VIIANFTPVVRNGYRLGVPRGGMYAEVINTDAVEYGGSGLGNLGGLQAMAAPAQGRPFSLQLELPALATLIFRLGSQHLLS
jgi:1,4-alpha-glucan branching enzyme